jgi:hypothetical protein
VGTKRSVPEEKAASIEEVRAAGDALTEDEIYQLEAYAQFRIRRIDLAADGREYLDLLGEAFRLTLQGNRVWNKDRSFAQHLKNTMESVSGHWVETFKKELKDGRDRIRTDQDSRTDMTTSTAGAVSAYPFDDSEERVRAIHRALEEDPVAQMIVEGWEEGLGGPELKELLELDEKAYRTKVKWIQRRVAAAAYGRPAATKKGRAS